MNDRLAPPRERGALFRRRCYPKYNSLCPGFPMVEFPLPGGHKLASCLPRHRSQIVPFGSCNSYTFCRAAWRLRWDRSLRSSASSWASRCRSGLSGRRFSSSFSAFRKASSPKSGLLNRFLQLRATSCSVSNAVPSPEPQRLPTAHSEQLNPPKRGMRFCRFFAGAGIRRLLLPSGLTCQQDFLPTPF